MKAIFTDWRDLIKEEFKKPYYKELMSFLKTEYEQNIIYPSKENIFEAINLTPYKDVKVVILGQDPYQTPNFAHGLSFSVNIGVTIPRSLNNIYKELNSDSSCHGLG